MSKINLSLSLTNPPRRLPIEIEKDATANQLFEVASLATSKNIFFSFPILLTYVCIYLSLNGILILYIHLLLNMVRYPAGKHEVDLSW